MTAGASKAGLTITPKPALALSPQPQPAPTARSLPPELVAREGQNWTPMVGQIWKPIDSQGGVCPPPSLQGASTLQQQGRDASTHTDNSDDDERGQDNS